MGKSTGRQVGLEADLDEVFVLEDEIIYVGMDDGHAECKLVTSNGLKFKMPSKAIPGRKYVNLNLGDEQPFVILSVSNEYGVERDFTVSASSIDALETRTSDYPYSDLNLILIHAALGNAGLGQPLGAKAQKVKICTGLPIGDAYLANGAPNKELIAKKTTNLSRSVKVEGSEPCEIAANVLLAEGVAAIIDLSVDEEGHFTEFAQLAQNSLQMFIDIGGKTTDYGVLINGGKGLDGNRFGSIDLGLMHVADKVAAVISADLKLESGTLLGSHLAVQKLLEDGSFKWLGVNRHYGHIVDEIKNEVAAEIKQKIQFRCKSVGDVDRIIFIGGGASFFKPVFEKVYPDQALFPDDPQFANARGMLKFAKYIAPQTKQNQ